MANLTPSIQELKNELQYVVKKIKCACHEAEVQASYSMSLPPSFSKQQPPYGLEVTVMALRCKCNGKDRVIAAMAKELKSRTDSKSFEKILKSIAETSGAGRHFEHNLRKKVAPCQHSNCKCTRCQKNAVAVIASAPSVKGVCRCSQPYNPSSPCPNYEARSPLLDQLHATVSAPLKCPVSCPVLGNHTGVYPVKGAAQQLSTSSPKSPSGFSSDPKKSSGNSVPNDSKSTTYGHPNFPNCSCRVTQDKPSTPIRKAPIKCKDCYLPNDPNAGTCWHPKFPNCPCAVPLELPRNPNVPKDCREACLYNDSLSVKDTEQLSTSAPKCLSGVSSGPKRPSGNCVPNDSKLSTFAHSAFPYCSCRVNQDKPSEPTRKVPIGCKYRCPLNDQNASTCMHPKFPNCPCEVPSELPDYPDVPKDNKEACLPNDSSSVKGVDNSDVPKDYKEACLPNDSSSVKGAGQQFSISSPKSPSGVSSSPQKSSVNQDKPSEPTRKVPIGCKDRCLPNDPNASTCMHPKFPNCPCGVPSELFDYPDVPKNYKEACLPNDSSSAKGVEQLSIASRKSPSGVSSSPKQSSVYQDKPSEPKRRVPIGCKDCCLPNDPNASTCMHPTFPKCPCGVPSELLDNPDVPKDYKEACLPNDLSSVKGVDNSDVPKDYKEACLPNDSSSVKGAEQQLTICSPKSPYDLSSSPKQTSGNCAPNDSKLGPSGHPDFPNCSCRVNQDKPSEPTPKVPIGCKDRCLPNDPNASTCRHPKFLNCHCGVPSELLGYPDVPKDCKEACLPNDSSSVKGAGQQLSTSSPKSPSSGPKNNSKFGTYGHPNFPNCSCRVIQDQPSEPVQKVPIECKDCCLPNDPNASTCMHPKVPNCPCGASSELLRYPNVPKGCKETCLPNDSSSGICMHSDFPNCPCGPADKPPPTTDAEENVRNCPCSSEFKSALDIPFSTPKQPRVKGCNHSDHSCCACETEILNKNTSELTKYRSCDHPDYPFCPCAAHDHKPKHVGTNTSKSIVCEDYKQLELIDKSTCPEPKQQALMNQTELNRKMPQKCGARRCFCAMPKRSMIPCSCASCSKKAQERHKSNSCASCSKKAQERHKSKSPATRPRSRSATRKNRCSCSSGDKAEKKNTCRPSGSKVECRGKTHVKQMGLALEDCGAISSTVKINEVKRLNPDSLIIKWKRNGKRGVLGYEIEVDGIVKSRVFSGGRTSAVLHAVGLKDALNLAVYCTNENGRFDAPARAIFQA